MGLLDVPDTAASASCDPRRVIAAGYLEAGICVSTVFLAAGFLAAGFLATGFLATGFFATGFLAAGFLAAGFLAAGFLAAGFFAVVFFFAILGLPGPRHGPAVLIANMGDHGTTQTAKTAHQSLGRSEMGTQVC